MAGPKYLWAVEFQLLRTAGTGAYVIQGAATSNGRRDWTWFDQLRSSRPEWMVLSSFRLRREHDILCLHRINGTEWIP